MWTTPLWLEGKIVQRFIADISNSTTVEVYTDVGTSSALLNVATVNDVIVDNIVLGVNDNILMVRAGGLAPARLRKPWGTWDLLYDNHFLPDLKSLVQTCRLGEGHPLNAKEVLSKHG